MTGAGLSDRLGHHFRPANRGQRLLQLAAATRGGARVLSRVLPRLDALTQRATRGRHTLPGLLVGLPVIDLTTTGRRSGRRRTSRLIAVPHRDTLALIGTNFGQPSTPAWVLNLEAEPRARVGYRGVEVAVRARLAGPEEAEEILHASADYYAGFRTYRSRIRDRRLRVFVLET